jgi:hypothetical protein
MIFLWKILENDDIPWFFHGFSMVYPWFFHGFSSEIMEFKPGNGCFFSDIDRCFSLDKLDMFNYFWL